MLSKKTIAKRAITLAMAVAVGIGGVSAVGTVEASAASKGGQPSKVSVVSAKGTDYDRVQIKWKKAKKARKYQVYRSTKLKGKYKLIKTTKSRSFTNTKLETGKTYYYKVRAVSKKGKKGKFSYRKAAKPMLKTPSFKIRSAGDTSVTVSYGKVRGASGYQVYRATSKDGKYSKIGSYKERTVKNTGLSNETNYWYKARAYRKVGKKYVYGGFSAKRSAETGKCSWVVKSDNESKTVYECSNCGAVKTHTHKWVPYKNEDGSVTEDRCDCSKTRAHVCVSWTPVKNGDGIVTEDKCNDCGKTRPHTHEWKERKEYGELETGHYVRDTKVYNVCCTCYDKGIWYADDPEANEKAGVDFFEKHIREHILAGEATGGWFTQQKDPKKFSNLTEEDCQIWVPDKGYKVVGYKCSTCGSEKGLE